MLIHSRSQGVVLLQTHRHAPLTPFCTCRYCGLLLPRGDWPRLIVALWKRLCFRKERLDRNNLTPVLYENGPVLSVIGRRIGSFKWWHNCGHRQSSLLSVLLNEVKLKRWFSGPKSRISGLFTNVLLDESKRKNPSSYQSRYIKLKCDFRVLEIYSRLIVLTLLWPGHYQLGEDGKSPGHSTTFLSLRSLAVWGGQHPGR